jgi:Protein of unknown function (DUF4230)
MSNDLQDPERVTGTERLAKAGRIAQVSGYWRLGRRAWGMARVLAVVAVGIALVVVVLSAVHLLPRLKNPFAETTTVRSGPALLKSITALSRYEAASGSFQVVVDLSTKSSLLPSFIEGSQTLFVGSGTDIAFVDFSHLSGKAVVVSRNRRTVTITLPPARLEPAVLNVRRSYAFAEQQGVLNRIGNFFSTNPDSEQRVYQAAQHKIQQAAKSSPLVAQAEKNTTTMLTGLLHSLGFKQVTVTFHGTEGLAQCGGKCGLKH